MSAVRGFCAGFKTGPRFVSLFYIAFAKSIMVSICFITMSGAIAINRAGMLC